MNCATRSPVPVGVEGDDVGMQKRAAVDLGLVGVRVLIRQRRRPGGDGQRRGGVLGPRPVKGAFHQRKGAGFQRRVIAAIACPGEIHAVARLVVEIPEQDARIVAEAADHVPHIGLKVGQRARPTSPLRGRARRWRGCCGRPAPGGLRAPDRLRPAEAAIVEQAGHRVDPVVRRDPPSPGRAASSSPSRSCSQPWNGRLTRIALKPISPPSRVRARWWPRRTCRGATSR